MTSHVDPETGEITRQRRSTSPHLRRALRQGPRTRVVTRPSHSRSRGTVPGTRDAGPIEASAAEARTVPRLLAEWHDMTPGLQAAAWAGLRAWVAWLHDRYELSTEDRLPRCWPRHPGLVEELWALRAWREEIYTTGPPSAQSARYWHAELRQVLTAARTLYAAGCRTGHRGAPALVADDPELQEEWASGYPLAGVAGLDIAAGRARQSGDCMTAAVIAAALDAGAARPVPFMRDYVLYAGTWWVPAASGWIQVPAPTLPGTGDPFPPGTGGPFSSGPDAARAGRPADEGGDPWES
jgi:hypothetical protein